MSTSTTTRRVVEPAEPAGRLHLPDQWLRALVAGAEAAILSWLVVVVPAIATYVATASSPALGSAHWVAAARVGTSVWLLAHGGAPAVAEVTISVAPLGLTLIAFAVLVGSVRRAKIPSWSAGVFAVVAYVGFATAFLAFAAAPGTRRAVLGAAVVALLAVACGMREAAKPAWQRKLRARVPQWLTDAVGLGWRILVVHLALAAAATIAMFLTNLDEIGELHSQLAPGAVSTVVLVAAQLLVLPTLMVWTSAYLLGPGFAVGAGTVFAPDGIVAGPLPVVPMLGGLPQPDSLWGEVPLIGLTGILTGLIAGAWLVRRLRRRPVPAMTGAVILGAVLAAGVLAALACLTSGAVGPGAMSRLGADWLATGLALLWQAGLGAAVVIVLAHPAAARLGARVRSGIGMWWQQVRG